jgi:hypothetical protein
MLLWGCAAALRCAASHARPAVLPPARTWREQPLRLCNPAIRFHAGCTSSRRCSHCCTSNASSAAVEVRCFLQLPGCRPRSPPLPPQHKAVVAALLPGRGCCAQRRTPLHPYIAARAHPATCSTACRRTGSPSMAQASCRSRMALASTMFRTMKRLMALSLGTMAAEDSQRTRFTWPAEASPRDPLSTPPMSVGAQQRGRNAEGRPAGAMQSIAPRPCLLRPEFLRFLLMAAVLRRS